LVTNLIGVVVINNIIIFILIFIIIIINIIMIIITIIIVSVTINTTIIIIIKKNKDHKFDLNDRIHVTTLIVKLIYPYKFHIINEWSKKNFEFHNKG